MDDGGGIAASNAGWVLGEKAGARLLPAAVISTLTSVGPLGIKKRFALAITGDDVAATLALGEHTATRSN